MMTVCAEAVAGSEKITAAANRAGRTLVIFMTALQSLHALNVRQYFTPHLTCAHYPFVFFFFIINTEPKHAAHVTCDLISNLRPWERGRFSLCSEFRDQVGDIRCDPPH